MPEIIVTLGENVVGRYVFDKDVMSIGRARDNDIVIENLAVSRNHARIRCQGDKFILSDLNSANGTYVNGVRVTKTELFNGDEIAIGKHKLLFKNEPLSDEAMISDAFGAERTMLLEPTPVAYLVVTRGKQKDMEFRVAQSEVTIGRGSDCDICLHDWFISKRHAVIHRQGNMFLLRDAGSWRGTKVNDVQITETVLKDGDEIQLGGVRLTFRLAREEMPVAGGERGVAGRLAEPVESAEPTPVPAEQVQGEVEQQEEEEPIRAGSQDDYIEPSVRPPVEMVAAGEGEAERESLGEELREGEQIVREAVRESTAGLDSARDLVEEKVDREAPESELERVERERRQASLEHEIKLWENALKNKSPVIRRQAAKMLKKLTGKDYDH